MLSKRLVNRAKRSSIVLMTNEARVLKELRVAAGLSMRQAGNLVGKSDSYISHLENGRMEVPIGRKLEVLLNIYCSIKPKSFYERARKQRYCRTLKQDVESWLNKASNEDVKLVFKFITDYIK